MHSPRLPRGIVGVTAMALLLGTIASVQAPAASAEIIPVGSGSYTTDLVGAVPEGCNAAGTANVPIEDARAYLTENAPNTAIPTNDWWTSLVFKRATADGIVDTCKYSVPLHAHPASYLPRPGGLGISYTTQATLTGTALTREYHYVYNEDLRAGVQGLNAPLVKVDDWSDWTVSPWWEDGTRTLRATIGHGLPFSWYEATGGDATLTAGATAEVWLNTGGRLGLTINGHHYVAFAPQGTNWTQSGQTFSAPAGNFSVAVLPNATTETRTELADAFTPYGHSPVTNTEVDYTYNEAQAKVTATYSVTATPWAGSTETNAVVALYPHQSAVLTGATPIEQTYTSARGDMQVLVGVPGFTTVDRFHGVIPEIPAVATSDGADRAQLEGYLDAVASDPLGSTGEDTYWAGKGLGRASRIVEISDQLGRIGQRDATLAKIKGLLTDWFTASPGKTARVFAYNEDWGVLTGYPASYFSDTELNDHHFHYGYFIVAAATLARFDPEWAAEYGDMVDLLIRDANNYDRTDERFPYMRDFDPYAGHDWASGHGAFNAGNNQESSSEGMNFAGALIEWGQATGNTEIRDAGIYIYTTQAAAIQRYWFNSTGDIFPEGFPRESIGMVWGDGGAYAIWFEGGAEQIQGINYLPVTGSHFYLGYDPATVRRLYAQMEQLSGSGAPRSWQDILLQFYALGDGDAALAKFRANSGFASEAGESKAHTFNWIRNLSALGTVDTTVIADTPLYQVFNKNGVRTYVATNTTDETIYVHFSDGATLEVPAGKTATSGLHTWQGGNQSCAMPTDPNQTDPGDPAGASNSLKLGTDSDLSNVVSAPSTVVIASAGGANHDGTPNQPATFTATGLTGPVTSATTSFQLRVDGGNTPGAGIQARVSYDFDGDGTFDRTETYPYFATDPFAGDQSYISGPPLTVTGGALADLNNGTVQLELWAAIGNAPMSVTTGANSYVVVPHDLPDPVLPEPEPGHTPPGRCNPDGTDPGTGPGVDPGPGDFDFDPTDPVIPDPDPTDPDPTDPDPTDPDPTDPDPTDPDPTDPDPTDPDPTDPGPTDPGGPGGQTPVATVATITANAKKSKYFKRAAVNVTARAAGIAPAGTVTVRRGTKVLGSQALTAGEATVLMPKKQKVGRHNLTVTFTPVAGSGVAPATAQLTLRKVKAKAKVKLVKAKAAKKKLRAANRSTVKVRVKVPGKAKLKGKVTIRIGKKVAGKAKVKKVKGKYIATIKTKNVRAAKKIRVVYSGDKRFARNALKVR